MPIYAFYYTVFILNSTLASRYSPTTEWEIGRYQVAQLKEEAPQLDQINHNERERERDRERERETEREEGGGAQRHILEWERVSGKKTTQDAISRRIQVGRPPPPPPPLEMAPVRLGAMAAS
jgi:hypothetical protein